MTGPGLLNTPFKASVSIALANAGVRFALNYTYFSFSQRIRLFSFGFVKIS